MKKKLGMIAILLCSLLVLAGCSSKQTITEIDYQTLKEKINQKETFILEVMQTGCSHCEEFSPRLRSILNDHDLHAYSLNLANLNSEEKAAFKEITYISGTPTTVFFTKGEEETAHKIVGAVPNSEVSSHLKDLGYLK